MSNYRKDLGFLFLIFLICLGLYWKPIAASPVLKFDDVMLVEPMEAVHSVGDYLRLWSDNSVMDLQPIRDLTYVAEHRVFDWTGWRSYPLTNLLFWLGGLAFTLGILRRVGFSRSWAYGLTSYLAIHPVAVNSIAWASGRKHILSMFFTVGATYLWILWLEKERRLFAWLAALMVALACLSQPINIAWFVWAALMAWLIRGEKPGVFRKSLAPVALTVLVSLATALANLWYYSNWRYIQNSMGGKFNPEGWDGVGNRLLIFGRYFFQLLLPVRPSVPSYDPGSPLALAGLFLLPLAIWLVFKILRPSFRDWGPWAAFLLLPLLVVSGPANQHFGWDTYLLTPLIGWTILIGRLATLAIERRHFAGLSRPTIGVLILAALLIQTRASASIWADETELWETALKRESNHFTLVVVAKTALAKGDLARAWPIILGIRETYPTHPELPYLLGRGIYDNPTLSPDEREAWFRRYELSGPWYQYYRAASLARQGRFAEADDRMNDVIKNQLPTALQYFGPEISAITAAWYAMCVYAKREACSEHVAKVRAALPQSKWSDSAFRERLALFKLSFNSQN